MAKLTREDVLRLADLAQLELTNDEVESFKQEISQILGYVEQLQKVNTKDLEPTYQVTGLKNVMRTDAPIKYQALPIALLKNVPEVKDGYIKVKKVL